MHAERDHLVRFVFPQLREVLLTRRIHLIDVDLRWGVTSEQNVQEVCHEIIDECRPRFLCILGGRYGWVPPGADVSITADEVKYGVLDRLHEGGHGFFYFRDPLSTSAIVEDIPGEFREPPGSAGERKLLVLKRAIEQAGLRPFIYSPAWSVSQRCLVALESFGDRVFRDLLDSFLSDPDLARRFTQDSAKANAFDDEQAAMEAFVAERVEHFIIGSRQPILDSLLSFVANHATPNVLVVTGDSGSGKSALLAKFCRGLGSPPDTLIIPHFIGASAGSTDLRQSLRRLCETLAPDQSAPQEVKELIERFDVLLKSGTQRVVLVLDALNQLDRSDAAHYLHWLPKDLPPNVRIVTSTLPNSILEILRNRGAHIETLGPLSEPDSYAIIQEFLQRYAKRLDALQLAALLKKNDAYLPLYLLTALEELRTLGTYDEITARIRDLPGGIRALFIWILRERLASDAGFRDRAGHLCGATLVAKLGAYLGVSRHGLSAGELSALLAPGETADATDDQAGNVAALLRLLRPYLMRRGELVDFFHAQLREAVEAEYLDTDAKRDTANRALAEKFQRDADPLGDRSYDGATSHALSELTHHQSCAQMWPELVATLENIFFLEAKVARGMAFALAADYSDARRRLPLNHSEQQVLLLLEQALGNDLHFVAEHARDYPQAVFQCLWNAGWWHDSEESRKHYLPPPRSDGLESAVPPPLFSTLVEKWRQVWQQARPESIWLKSLRPLPDRLSEHGELKTITTDQGHMTCIDISAQGLLAAGFGDGSVALWDSESRRRVNAFAAKGPRVKSVRFSPLEPLLLGSYGDGSATIWDCDTGKQVLELSMEEETRFCGSLFFPDGKTLIRGGYGKVFVWDASTGALLRTVPIATRLSGCGPIHQIDVSPDAQLLAFSDGSLLGVISFETGKLIWEDRANCQCLSFSRTSAHLFAGIRTSISVYSAQTGGEEARMRRSGEVTCLASDPRGLVACGSLRPSVDHDAGFADWQEAEDDRSVIVWDWNAAAPPRAVGEGAQICDVKFSPEGKRIVAGSVDGAIRFFPVDSVTPNAHRPIGIPRAEIVAIAACKDGTHVAVAYENREAALWQVPDFSLLAYLHTDKTRSFVTFDPPAGFDAMAYALGWRDPTYELTNIGFGHGSVEVILLFGQARLYTGETIATKKSLVWSWVQDTVIEAPSKADPSIQTGTRTGHRHVCEFGESEVVLRRSDSKEPVAYFSARQVNIGVAPGAQNVWVVASRSNLHAFVVQPARFDP